MNLKKIQLFYILTKPLLYEGHVQDETLGKVSVSSCYRPDDNAVAKVDLMKLGAVLLENHGTSQMNEAKCFRCNVTKMQEDFLWKFCYCVCYL